MHYTDLHTIEKLTALRVEAIREQAQSHSLLRQAGFVQPGKLSQQVYRLLGHMGHQLVALGEWLKQYGSPQPSY